MVNRAPLLTLAGLMALVPLLGCARTVPSPSAERPTVVILGAASTKDVLQEIAALGASDATTGTTIEISTGPSHALTQQILSGAPVDIFVSANRQWADAIAKENLAENSLDWLTNELVVVSPADSTVTIDELSDLLSPEVERVAVAGENVPAGIYAQQALSYHKLWDRLHSAGKIVRGHDVHSALAFAQRQEVDAAIVYATDARSSADVKVVARFDSASHDRIVYPLVLLKTKEHRSAAEQVFRLLRSPEAMAIAREHGFTPLIHTGN